MEPPTCFEVWAQIIIPAATGAGTLLISALAWRTSRQAAKLAREVEDQRARAESQRAVDDRKRRLQDLAVEEARLLHRWVVETVDTAGKTRVPIAITFGEPAPPTTAQQEAATQARVALTQSIVPAAQSLLEITSIDLQLREGLPSADGQDATEANGHSGSRRAFDDRTSARIRDWALDPEAAGDGSTKSCNWPLMTRQRTFKASTPE